MIIGASASGQGELLTKTVSGSPGELAVSENPAGSSCNYDRWWDTVDKQGLIELHLDCFLSQGHRFGCSGIKTDFIFCTFREGVVNREIWLLERHLELQHREKNKMSHSNFVREHFDAGATEPEVIRLHLCI